MLPKLVKSTGVVIALMGFAVGAAAPAATAGGLPGGPNDPQPVVTFAPGSFPESIYPAGDGLLVTLGFAGELVRVTGGQTQAVAAVELGGASLLTGVVVANGYAYFARAPFGGAGPAYLYRVDPSIDNGVVTPWITLAESGSFPNGLAVRDGVLYVADSLGAVWTVPLSDPSAAAVWCADPLLQPRRGFGVNGITFAADGTLYADVSEFGRIVTIGTTGDTCTVTPVIEDQQLRTADGIAFGPGGDLYVTVNATNRVYAVDVVEATVSPMLANRSDGLSYPTQAVFADESTMLVTNGALANGVPDLVAVTVE